MGGTLIRLAAHGHEVHVAYQTSGSIAVFDHDAIRFAEFAADYCREFDAHSEPILKMESHVEEFLKRKQPGQVDSDIVQRLKGLIRRGEAREGARVCGVKDEHLHHLDMPFYETGRVKKKPIEPGRHRYSDHRRLAPRQSNRTRSTLPVTYLIPHGTHRTCLKAIIRSLSTPVAKMTTGSRTCEVLAVSWSMAGMARPSD